MGGLPECSYPRRMASVESLLTLGQRGDELTLRHGDIRPMAALAIEDFVKLELFQYASRLGDGFRMQVDADVDVRMVRLGDDVERRRTLRQVAVVAARAEATGEGAARLTRGARFRIA